MRKRGLGGPLDGGLSVLIQPRESGDVALALHHGEPRAKVLVAAFEQPFRQRAVIRLAVSVASAPY